MSMSMYHYNYYVRLYVNQSICTGVLKGHLLDHAYAGANRMLHTGLKACITQSWVIEVCHSFVFWHFGQCCITLCLYA